MGPFGLNPLGLLVAFVGVLLAFKWVSGGRKESGASSAVLALQTFAVDRQAPDGTFVNIKGRASGLSNWLLTMMGLQPVSGLQVTARELYFKSVSLSGEEHHVVPLSSVSSTRCAYTKPFKYLIGAALLFLAGLWLGKVFFGSTGAALLLACIIGGVLLVRYWLTKTLVITVETSGGKTLGLSFKRSVLENVSVDMQQALHVIDVINEQVAGTQHGAARPRAKQPRTRASGSASRESSDDGVPASREKSSPPHGR